MGNSGGTAVARATVEELREFAAEAGFGAAGGGEEAAELGGGWVMLHVADQPAGGAAALSRRTGAPVITVAYLDSDVGFVEAATFAGGHWKALLNRDTAQDYGIPLDRFPVQPALEGALDWAAAAGLTADPAGVRTALTGSEPFAEDLADRLLTALGLDLA
ncbi:hypothetical protein OG429_16795 [Streptomyces sp. NBC_00190]|uniref:hypothetical protein n=1 Tax=Streptomyces sp. NBC_00190 TaxID=2903634 RepID=UPI002E289E74|nr:hypothetical protein [Streptomyces sp. NBC_00190]